MLLSQHALFFIHIMMLTRISVCFAMVAVFFGLSACQSSTAPAKKEEVLQDATGFTKIPIEGKNGLEQAARRDKYGKVVEEGFLLNGKKQGTWLTYHPNTAVVASCINYEQGIRQGAALKVAENGSVSEKMFFLDDMLEGEYTKYNYTHIKEKAYYVKNQLEGERKIFYVNGKPLEEGTFKDGKREGIAKWYDEAGKITIEKEYHNGEEVQ